MTANFCCNERIKNVLVVSITMGLVYMSFFTATALQNIALAESSDIELQVGYYAAIAKTVGSIVVGFVFQIVYQRLGLKLTSGLFILLCTSCYWPMIWIVNQYVIYAGEFLSGLGSGAMWVLCPMVVMDNSKEESSQRNMGYFFAFTSIGITVGGVCNYFYFEGVYTITAGNRIMVYGICAGLTILACLVGVLGTSEIKDGTKFNRSTAVDSEEVTYVKIDGNEEDVDSVFIENQTPKNNEEKIENKLGYSLKEVIAWLKKMGGRLAFWVHFIPLIYWSFTWGYLEKIFPTAIPSISDERKLIPLTTVIMGITTLIGASTWNLVSKWTSPTFCIIISTLLLLLAITLSVLIFPKDSASRILEVGTAETYLQPSPAYVIIISALIGLADSAVSIIYFNAAGRLYGEETSLGYSVNIFGYYVFYILSMFAPSIVDIHTYCYAMMVSVVAMCFSITVGLKNYL